MREIDIMTATENTVRPVMKNDFVNALKVSRPSVDEESLALFEAYNKKYGCSN